MKNWVNPTGKGVRSDSGGDGHFGAKRGERPHLGTDFLCVPGQGVVAVRDAFCTRVSRPYLEGAYQGLQLETEEQIIKMWYFLPLDAVKRQKVYAGQLLGWAQDISKKYGGDMQPHIHVQIGMKAFQVIGKRNVWNQDVVWVNPLLFISLEV